MNRRSFLTASGALKAGGIDMARKRGPGGTQARVQGLGLEPYTGPWGFEQAAHLLRRALIGVRPEDIATAVGMTMSRTVDKLLETQPNPNPPSAYTGQTEDPQWTTKTNKEYKTANADGTYVTYLLSWWIDLMMKQGFTLREKMVLFWHNHFATGHATVKDARYMYGQNALFRQYAFGNFKDLVRQITFDPAMLVYLNGNANKKGTPNENYARELQELFTIGKGPERAPGDYTNYTEADIKAAARILTGWSNALGDDSTAYTSATFNPGNHDSGTKTFSAAYGNRVINGATTEVGASGEIDQLIGMIFEQEATALYICRKLYRWFVDYMIDDSVEQDVIKPMAALLRASNFEIAPVVSALLKSRHFYEGGRTGCVIKTPVDVLVGTGRTFDWTGADIDTKDTKYITLSSTDMRQRNWRFRTLRRLMAAMGMDLMNPPNVAGWPAYWQSPSYHEMWVNADTLQKRINFLNDVSQNGLKLDESYGSALIDVIAFVKGLGTISDPTVMISAIASLLFPVTLTDTQLAGLNDILLPGLPDYEWDAEWSDYTADPTNATKQKTVEDKLRTLFKYMLAMAEYQLS